MRILQYATATQDRENQNGRKYLQNVNNHGNFDLFILDSSVRIKTRKRAEVT